MQNTPRTPKNRAVYYHEYYLQVTKPKRKAEQIARKEAEALNPKPRKVGPTYKHDYYINVQKPKRARERAERMKQTNAPQTTPPRAKKTANGTQNTQRA